MTRIREAAASQPQRVLFLAFSALFLLGMLAAVAHADERRGDDRRGGDHRFDRGGPGWNHYPPPPVAYGGPYYPPPPVVYGPGVGINLPGVSINLR